MVYKYKIKQLINILSNILKIKERNIYDKIIFNENYKCTNTYEDLSNDEIEAKVMIDDILYLFLFNKIKISIESSPYFISKNIKYISYDDYLYEPRIVEIHLGQRSKIFTCNSKSKLFEYNKTLSSRNRIFDYKYNYTSMIINDNIRKNYTRDKNCIYLTKLSILVCSSTYFSFNYYYFTYLYKIYKKKYMLKNRGVMLKKITNYIYIIYLFNYLLIYLFNYLFNYLFI